MKVGVLGTGMVGKTIGTKLVALGHEVTMGARTATNEKAAAWAKLTRRSRRVARNLRRCGGPRRAHTFNCTSGSGASTQLTAAGAENLRDKILIDCREPARLLEGHAATVLLLPATTSLGQQIQRAFPDSKVVKTLNTVNRQVMVDPEPGAGRARHLGERQRRRRQGTLSLTRSCAAGSAGKT